MHGSSAEGHVVNETAGVYTGMSTLKSPPRFCASLDSCAQYGSFFNLGQGGGRRINLAAYIETKDIRAARACDAASKS